MRPPLGSLANPRLHAPLSMTQECGNEQGTPFTLAQARVRRIYKSTPVQFAICIVIVAAYVCALVNAQVQVNVEFHFHAVHITNTSMILAGAQGWRSHILMYSVAVHCHQTLKWLEICTGVTGRGQLDVASLEHHGDGLHGQSSAQAAARMAAHNACIRTYISCRLELKGWGAAGAPLKNCTGHVFVD